MLAGTAHMKRKGRELEHRRNRIGFFVGFFVCLIVFTQLFAATAEAVAMCRKLGADLQTIYDVIRTAVGTSAIFEMRVPRIIDG